MKQMRKHMQIVFQDSVGSLDPRMKVGDLIAEGLGIHDLASRKERDAIVHEMLERVGMPPEAADRYPHQFSGGQRQRIGLARALVLQPKLVVADEPVSALDVSIQSQVLNLLVDLKQEFDLTYVFVAHDLAVVGYISDRVAVMYLGRIVEIAPSDELFARPLHPYTMALLSANPEPIPGRKSTQDRAQGRRAEPDRPAVRLPLPHPLPDRPADLLREGPGARGSRQRPPRRLSLPRHAAHRAHSPTLHDLERITADPRRQAAPRPARADARRDLAVRRRVPAARRRRACRRSSSGRRTSRRASASSPGAPGSRSAATPPSSSTAAAATSPTATSRPGRTTARTPTTPSPGPPASSGRTAASAPGAAATAASSSGSSPTCSTRTCSASPRRSFTTTTSGTATGPAARSSWR